MEKKLNNNHDQYSNNISSDEDLLVKSYRQSVHDLQNHKILLERAERIGRIGFWEYDVKNDTIWISDGARVIYGIDDCEVSSKNIENLIFPEYRHTVNQMLGDLIHHKKKYDLEFKIHRQNDGAIADVRSQAEHDRQANKIYGIIQDISLQRKTELELTKARFRAEESNRLKSAFVSNMSHEIRTPMNGIVGYAHMLAENDLDHAIRMEYKENIHLCCNQLLDKVNDILDIAKIESGDVVINPEGVKLNELCNDIYRNKLQQANSRNLQFFFKSGCSDKELIILTDGAKLRKIILNLIDNAIRFTKSGFVEFGYRVIDAELEFFVKDTGIGIDPAHYEIIFQPFCQAHSQISKEFGGTGLGLSIAKTYVAMLAGKLWFESQLNIGTTFYFTLANTDISKKSSDKHLSEKKFSQPKKSLVVDDLEINYQYLKILLELFEFSVLWAKDGKAAIELVQNNPDIDLVLMDIRLPDINGYEVTRTIRRIRPSLPVIAQTAYALQNEREKALEAGCIDYITKPIYKDEFEKTLRRFFD